MQSEQFQLHADIELRHWWFVARRQLMQSMVERLVPPAPEKNASTRPTVIDVGCGTGANIAALVDGYHAVGIDTSADAIRHAADRFPRVDFRAGYAPQDLGDCLPVAKLVMMMDVLEHVEDDFQLLSSIMSDAEPGTLFLLTVPADITLWSPHDESFGHYRRYDADRLRQIWQGLPVKERMLSYYNTRLYPLVKMIRSRNSRNGESGGTAGTDFKIPHTFANAALKTIFSGERRRLLKQLDEHPPQAYGQGVSLMAVLERGEGSFEPRCKPESAPADYFDPVAGELVGAGG